MHSHLRHRGSRISIQHIAISIQPLLIHRHTRRQRRRRGIRPIRNRKLRPLTRHLRRIPINSILTHRIGRGLSVNKLRQILDLCMPIVSSAELQRITIISLLAINGLHHMNSHFLRQVPCDIFPLLGDFQERRLCLVYHCESITKGCVISLEPFNLVFSY